MHAIADHSDREKTSGHLIGLDSPSATTLGSFHPPPPSRDFFLISHVIRYADFRYKLHDKSLLAVVINNFLFPC